MKFSIFTELYSQALEYDDYELYLSERGWQEWMEKYDKAEHIDNVLEAIYFLAHNSIEQVRKRFNLSRVNLSKFSYIPIRTLENREANEAQLDDKLTCKKHVYDRLYISYILFMEFVEDANE